MFAASAVLGATLLLAQSNETASSARAPEPEVKLRPEQAQAVVERVFERVPFLKSPTARAERDTMGRYFRRAEYRDLKGNPLLGYWDDGGFRWSGPRIAFGNVASTTADCRRISESAWRAVFARVADSMSLVVDERAPMRLDAGCVAAVVDATAAEPVPGVLLEMRLSGAQGTFRYRLGVGRPSVEDAMGATVEFALRAIRELAGGGL